MRRRRGSSFSPRPRAGSRGARRWGRGSGRGAASPRASLTISSPRAAAASPSQGHSPLAPQRRHHSLWSKLLSTCSAAAEGVCHRGWRGAWLQRSGRARERRWRATPRGAGSPFAHRIEAALVDDAPEGPRPARCADEDVVSGPRSQGRRKGAVRGPRGDRGVWQPACRAASGRLRPRTRACCGTPPAPRRTICGRRPRRTPSG